MSSPLTRSFRIPRHPSYYYCYSSSSSSSSSSSCLSTPTRKIIIPLSFVSSSSSLYSFSSSLVPPSSTSFSPSFLSSYSSSSLRSSSSFLSLPSPHHHQLPSILGYLQDLSMKFYAVRKGRQPGIYNTWSECEMQVKKFSKGEYHSFGTREEAQRYIDAGSSSSSSSCSSPSSSSSSSSLSSLLSHKRSAVPPSPPSMKRQRSPSTTSASSSTSRFSHFLPPVAPHSLSSLSSSPSAISSFSSSLSSSALSLNPRVKKSSFSSSSSASSACSTPSSSSSSSSSASASASSSLIMVWTDGACSGNGTISSSGGIGIYFGLQDTRNLAEPLPECYRPHTNQKAELFAAIRAVQLLLSSSSSFDSFDSSTSSETRVILHTDSAYTIGWATKWGPDWERRNWRKGNGERASNEELAKLLLRTLEEAREQGFEIEFKHVPGHSGFVENEEADKLAVRGAQMCTSATFSASRTVQMTAESSASSSKEHEEFYC